jgi:putative nucleotidyltransferase with HDIG domain
MLGLAQAKPGSRETYSNGMQFSVTNDSDHRINSDTFPEGKDFLSWVAVVIIGLAGLFLAFSLNNLFNPGLKVGDIADHTVRVKRRTVVNDLEMTKKAQDQLRHSMIPAFKEDTSKYATFLNTVKESLNTVNQLQNAGITPNPVDIDPDEHLRLLETTTPLANLGQMIASRHLMTIQAQRGALKALRSTNSQLNSDQIYLAIAVNPHDFDKFAQSAETASVKICHLLKRYSQDDQPQWQETVIELLPNQWTDKVKARFANIICSKLTPNYVIDEKATSKKEAAILSNIKPVTKVLEPGQIVLQRGELVNEENIQTLNEVGAVTGIKWPLILSIALSILTGGGLIGLYLFTYAPQHFFSTSSIGLMFTVCISTCAAATTVGRIYPQLVPLPAAALVLTIFFGRTVASLITVLMLTILAADRTLDANNIIALGTASGAAIAAYSRQKHDLVFSGLIISMAQPLGFIASLAINQPSSDVMHSIASLVKMIALSLFGGITSAMVSIGSLPFLENIFGMLTPFRLAELTNADQPLLRKLEEEAPGTYQHSLAVANLAEGAARAIGCDANLVRAGALYHDIGKAVQPRYFIENQLGDKNPHDDISPEESRDRVLAHVTNGIALAKKHGLPKALRDFIPMHQGTSLIAYFFHKACLRDGVDKVDPNSYRYPGPKPQSKETAIVMLADVSEAVTHSMKDPTQEEVEEALTKVFENRWQDGQFDQSTLTFDELQKVKAAFARVWRTLHHDRLKYPSTTTGRMPMPPENI